MIIKNYEINKINFEINKYFLLYGSNQGAKEEAIDLIVKKANIKAIIKFEEKQVLENNEVLFHEILESHFRRQKTIIINDLQINY